MRKTAIAITTPRTTTGTTTIIGGIIAGITGDIVVIVINTSTN